MRVTAARPNHVSASMGALIAALPNVRNGSETDISGRAAYRPVTVGRKDGAVRFEHDELKLPLVIVTREMKMINSSGSNDEPSREGGCDEKREPHSRTEYDAELRNWSIHDNDRSFVAFGRVFNDRTGRWPDGYAISTSTVMSGPCEEGAVITTRNTRYLLSGPAGDHEAMLQLARQQAANAARRTSVAQDEDYFDLLPAAWGMDDTTFETIARLPAGWLWQWRNHYRAPTDAELAFVRRLGRFHDAIRLVTFGEPDYRGWWRHKWSEQSPIGRRSPLEAVLQDPACLDRLERYFRSQM